MRSETMRSETMEGKSAHVVLPQIGLGAFLSGLHNTDDVYFAKSTLGSALEELVPLYPYLKMHYVIYTHNSHDRKCVQMSDNFFVITETCLRF